MRAFRPDPATLVVAAALSLALVGCDTSEAPERRDATSPGSALTDAAPGSPESTPDGSVQRLPEAVDSGTAPGGPELAAPTVATVIVLPDTQFYSAYFPDIYTAQTKWIVAQAKVRNIQAVLHVGDLVDSYDSTDQWNNASAAMRLMDGVVPYVLVPGNHDVGRDLRQTPINNYFAPQTMPWILGTFENGKIENNYALIDIGGRKYVVLGLEFGPRNAVLSWADGILKSYAAYPAILVTHAFLDGDSRYDWAQYPNNVGQYWNPHLYALNSSPAAEVNDGEEIYQKLIAPNPKLRLVFCGHVLGDTTYGAVGRLTDVRPDGTHIHQMLSDYQVIPLNGIECGLGYLRILEFDTGKKEIRVSTYSPYLSQLMSVPEAEATFTLPLDD
jgi:predicted phosphodiesterase